MVLWCLRVAVLVSGSQASMKGIKTSLHFSGPSLTKVNPFNFQHAKYELENFSIITFMWR